MSKRKMMRAILSYGAMFMMLFFAFPADAERVMVEGEAAGAPLQTSPNHPASAEPCPSGTLLNPYPGACAPVMDAAARPPLPRMSSGPEVPPSLIDLRKQIRRNRTDVIPFPNEDEDIHVPGGLGAGITYERGSLQALDHSELHTRMFVYPDGVDPSFPGLTWLFSTATNRTHRGVEVVGVYYGSNEGSLGIFDWSCSSDDPCEGGRTDPSWIWSRHFSDVPCNMTEILDQGGHLQKVMQYANQTVKMDDEDPPLWRNAVYLWNFCRSGWDLVYEHAYRIHQTDCSAANSCGWWGPILETFDDPLPQINELGFEDTLLYHDGHWSQLPPEETGFRAPVAPWTLFHVTPNRAFGAGNFVRTGATLYELSSFTYQDDAFLDTHRPAYASGRLTPTGGYDGSEGLHVVVGNVDYQHVLDGMSGGWSRDFDLPESSEVEICLKYRLMTTRFDADECGEALVSVDGTIVRNLAKLCGRGLDTGWREEAFTLTLPQGRHTLTVGAYNNKKTGMLEKTDAYFDDIAFRIVSGPAVETDCGNGMDDDGDGLTDCSDPDCAGSSDCEGAPLLALDFDGCDHGLVYGDDMFWGTNQPAYASGKCTPDEGNAGTGGLHLSLGNVDGKDVLNGISGGWTGEFYLHDDADVRVSLDYRLVMTRFDADECAEVLLKIDEGPVIVLEKLCYRGKDTQWQTQAFTRRLSAGHHTITIGGYNNKKTGEREIADIYLDNLYVR